jgi:hypothetical protein
LRAAAARNGLLLRYDPGVHDLLGQLAELEVPVLQQPAEDIERAIWCQVEPLHQDAGGLTDHRPARKGLLQVLNFLRAGQGHADVRCEGHVVVDVIGGESRPFLAIEVQRAEVVAGGEQAVADDAEQSQPTDDLRALSRPALVDGQIAALHGVLLPQRVEARLVQLVLQ